MRISDWSSDVCSSDLDSERQRIPREGLAHHREGQAYQSVGAHLQQYASEDGRGGPRRVDMRRRQPSVHRKQGRLDAKTEHEAEEHQPCAQIQEIGRASCRERVCQYGMISVVAVSIKKKT